MPSVQRVKTAEKDRLEPLDLTRRIPKQFQHNQAQCIFNRRFLIWLPGNENAEDSAETWTFCRTISSLPVRSKLLSRSVSERFCRLLKIQNTGSMPDPMKGPDCQEETGRILTLR